MDELTLLREDVPHPGPVLFDAADDRLHLTDSGNAVRIVRAFGHDLRYCWPQARWYVWTGQRWKADETGHVHELAAELPRITLRQASSIDDLELRKAAAEHSLKSESERSRKATVSLAQAEPGIAVLPQEFDIDPWLLNVQNGTLDLRSGELRPHQREDMITRICPVAYEPTARSAVWEDFLATVTGGDEELQRFLAQVTGYALTGDTREEKLFFVCGPTRSGKSTFLGALQSTLGEDYAHTADFQTFLRDPNRSGPRDDLAQIEGRRLVISIETDKGARLAEGLVKQLTGGDRIRARRLYANSTEFRPQAKFLLAANDRPRADDLDEALWRRILEVPFDRSFGAQECDPQVKLALCNPAQHGAAILAWAVRGCMDWQANGLTIPTRVQRSTQSYRQSQDPLTDFLADCCVRADHAWAKSADIYQAYEGWARAEGQKHLLTRKAIGSRLAALGCAEERRGGRGDQARGWRGVGLRDAAVGM